MDIMKLLADFAASSADIDAEMERYAQTDWFKDYPPAVKALTSGNRADQLYNLQNALAMGADPEASAPDRVTAAKLALDQRNLAALQMLHQAGARFANREWSPLHRAVLFGQTSDVEALATVDACGMLDSWSWSPLLLACAMGQTDAAKVLWPLTPAAARQDPTDDGENALILAATCGDTALVEWLLDQGTPVDWPDRYGGTALLAAVGTGKHALVETLLKRGANPNPRQNISASLCDREPVSHPAASIADRLWESVAKLAPDIVNPMDDLDDTMTGPFDYAIDVEMVRLLVNYAYPLDQVPDHHFPTAIGADLMPDPMPSRADLADHGSARAGVSNPERVAPSFWMSQIRSGDSGYHGAEAILGMGRGRPSPVWSFDRFGRSVTRLPDGRIVCIAGEHEDSYDADFCIYADVTVLDGKGGVEHYIYPAKDFPPTDFHTATLVDETIWLIGSTGYQGARGDKAQVLALSIKDWSIRRVQTQGDDPGWISRHKAVLEAGRIVVWEGSFPPDFRKKPGCWSLDMADLTWRREGHA